MRLLRVVVVATWKLPLNQSFVSFGSPTAKGPASNRAAAARVNIHVRAHVRVHLQYIVIPATEENIIARQKTNI